MLAHDLGRQLGLALANRLRQHDMILCAGDQVLGLNRQVIGQPLEPPANIFDRAAQKQVAGCVQPRLVIGFIALFPGLFVPG